MLEKKIRAKFTETIGNKLLFRKVALADVVAVKEWLEQLV